MVEITTLTESDPLNVNNWLLMQSHDGVFDFWKKNFEWKIFSGQWKTLFNHRKIYLVFKKMFSFYFRWKILSENCEKFRNVILFTDYIKFDSQTFDCYIYIYILFWIFVFQFHPLEFNFYINFSHDFYFTFPLSFFNWNFLSIKFGSHSFYCYLFYLK
jgi:hypothetical protein